MAIGEHEDRSLALHQAAVALMQADDAVRLRALEILRRWLVDIDENVRPVMVQWLPILENRDWDKALSQDQEGDQRRHASPCSCILPTDQRLAILAACRQRARELGRA